MDEVINKKKYTTINIFLLLPQYTIGGKIMGSHCTQKKRTAKKDSHCLIYTPQAA